MNMQLWCNMQIIFYLLQNLFMPLIHFNTFLINLDNQIDFVYTFFFFFLPHNNQGCILFSVPVHSMFCWFSMHCSATSRQKYFQHSIFAGTFKNTLFSNYVLRSNGNKMYILLARKITLHIIATPYVNLIYSSREGCVCKVKKLSFVS